MSLKTSLWGIMVLKSTKSIITCVQVLQVGQGCVECDGDSVLSGSVCLIGNLVAVQVHRDGFSDVHQYHPLKALHDYWGEGDWVLVIEGGNGRLFGDRDDGSGLKAGGNCSLL